MNWSWSTHPGYAEVQERLLGELKRLQKQYGDETSGLSVNEVVQQASRRR